MSSLSITTIVARRQPPIHAFQTEGSIKRDGFARVRSVISGIDLETA